ncbi:MAG: carbon starvation CstA family protein [Sedimentibacter saalensis]|jgi:carbon starvation protein CstA|uniref:Carbon starvation protein CstA n=1 Tax=Sedimentibacter saalensis TaxID=130788 RepID=A0A562J8D1_9FIRM|nr:carbon starvation CstA family protein [Sedimentibacter saalensis]MEA5093421.1 carbon starvation CstA family protein [Sedimentibacter saalensis]TWH79310.1 carbon starvation protein CstA [Sedimentibacter saalensis]
MATFLIGIIILVAGGFVYGKYCENVFGPDDRETPAISKADGVDFVVMKKWKNALIELLNIAGTGPIFGAIQGILFGPIAFITIPVGCVLAGSMHDYFSGMISMRNGGAQMPKLIKKYLGNKVIKAYNFFLWVLMFLVGVVFVYTPGDLIVTQVLRQEAAVANPTVWIVYGCIFVYYLIATLFPIDAIIGRVYPIFGGFLILSAVGIFVGVLMDGGANLTNLSFASNPFAQHATGLPFIPTFFITVACGIMSGFHATQATLISRTVKSEKEGKATFFNMMIVEGFIAMCWAAGAMVIFGRGTDLATAPTLMVGLVSRGFLGPIGGMIAVIGVIVLPITSGDTAFRSLRLMVSEQFNINQKVARNRIITTACLFVPAVFVLYYAKSSPTGFNILWRYFSFTNQFVATFALATISVYLYINGKNFLVALIPGMFYFFVTLSFIFHAPIGLKLDERLGMDPKSYTASFILAAICCIGYAWFVKTHGEKEKDHILQDVIS